MAAALQHDPSTQTHGAGGRTPNVRNGVIHGGRSRRVIGVMLIESEEYWISKLGSATITKSCFSGETPMRRFEFVDDESNKFWEANVNGKTLNITFGKIGTRGQSKPKNFATPEKANAEMEKLIKEKTSKGYVEKGKGKTSIKSIYPEIKRLKDAGATLIRTVFEGISDEGGFSSTVYKNNRILVISNQLDEDNNDINKIYENNKVEMPFGIGFGSISILTIELATGKCTVTDCESDRQSELFENLVWEGVEEIQARAAIVIDKEDENCFFSAKLRGKIVIKPCSKLPNGKKLSKHNVKNSLEWWLRCEQECDEFPNFFEDLSTKFKAHSFDLTVNTRKKVMEIKAGKKKITFKLSGFKTKKFNINI